MRQDCSPDALASECFFPFSRHFSVAFSRFSASVRRFATVAIMPSGGGNDIVALLLKAERQGQLRARIRFLAYKKKCGRN